MAHVSLRMTDEEKTTIEAYANLQGETVSNVLKEAFFEKLEDEFDLKLIAEYEKEKPQKFYSHEEVGKILGLK